MQPRSQALYLALLPGSEVGRYAGFVHVTGIAKIVTSCRVPFPSRSDSMGMGTNLRYAAGFQAVVVRLLCAVIDIYQFP